MRFPVNMAENTNGMDGDTNGMARNMAGMGGNPIGMARNMVGMDGHTNGMARDFNGMAGDTNGKLRLISSILPITMCHYVLLWLMLRSSYAVLMLIYSKLCKSGHWHRFCILHGVSANAGHGAG